MFPCRIWACPALSGVLLSNTYLSDGREQNALLLLAQIITVHSVQVTWKEEFIKTCIWRQKNHRLERKPITSSSTVTEEPLVSLQEENQTRRAQMLCGLSRTEARTTSLESILSQNLKTLLTNSSLWIHTLHAMKSFYRKCKLFHPSVIESLSRPRMMS